MHMNRRTLWTLYGCNFLDAIGVWFFLPLLPIFLGRKGGSAALVGAVFAAGLLGNGAIRYPAGWAADRFGTRPVMVGALALYSVFFLAYLLPLPLPAFIAVRFLHGAAGGAYVPASNGLVAAVTAPGQRSQAYGMMQSTNLAGMLVGPAIGGFIALFNLNAVFVAGIEVPPRALRIARSLLPLIVLGAGTSYMIGSFDTIWSLYMTYRGATPFAVGISFATFALPAMLVSAYTGALGNRFGSMRLIGGALMGTAIFAAVYPFVTSVPWLIGLGLIEGAFTVSGGPSLLAEVSRAAEPGYQARTQGLFQTIQTAIQIIGTLAGGYLFTIGPTYAFLAISVVCLLGAASPLLMRGRMSRGSVAHVLEPPPPV